MRFSLRRGERGNDRLRALLAEECDTIEQVLARASREHSTTDGEVALAPLLKELFDGAPTADIDALKGRGMDASSFLREELEPNWDGLSRGERAAKIESFMRLANVLGTDDPGGVGAIVRTKVVVLAWAYDRAYGEDLLGRIARSPQRFGRFDVPVAR